MSGNTYTYIGPSGSAVVPNSPSYWTPTLPSGEEGPHPGDDIVFNAGTLLLNDQVLEDQTVFLRGGTLAFYGDAGISGSQTPTVDGASTITTDAARGETVSGAPQSATIDAFGNFVNEGTIAADGPAGSALTIAIAGTTIGGTFYPGNFTNYGEIDVEAGNTLIVTLTGSFELLNAGGEIQANGGYLDIQASTQAVVTGNGSIGAVVDIGNGGTVETNLTNANLTGGISVFDFTDSTAGNTLKIDNIGAFAGGINDFGYNDTIDLGSSLAVGSLVNSQELGVLDLEHNGSVVAALNLPSDNFTNGTFTLAGSVGHGSTATADGLGLTLGSDGDTVLTTSPVTYTYIGNPGTAYNPNTATVPLWSPNGEPSSGDSAIFNAGTLLLEDITLQANTLYVAGGTLAFFGDASTTIHNSNNNGNVGPTLDPNTVITTDAAAAETVSGSAQHATLDTFGNFINEGTIAADGPAGSTLTITVAGTTINGTYVPGTFINYGKIVVDPGNTLDITIGATSDLLNGRQIDVTGGSLDIDVLPNALNGGYAGVGSVAIISDGGTLETNATYGTTVPGTIPYYVFTDSTAGNTVKIDNIGSFGGRFLGFGVGDTIDLGTVLPVTSLVYSATSGLLYLENGGAILDTLLFAAGDFTGGTVSGVIGHGTTATAGSFGLTLGADGNTELVSTVKNDSYNDTSGVWQTGADWTNGTPGALDTAFIGLGSKAAFTLTTGSVPVSVGDIALAGQDALLRITSATTVSGSSVQAFAGTLEVTSGNTLTAPFVRTLGGTVVVDSGAVLDAAGHVNFGSGSLTYFGSINGTLAVSTSGTTSVSINSGLLLVDGGTIDAGGTFNPATGSYAYGGSFLIGYQGSGTPAQVTIEATGTQHAVVTDTYAVIGSDLASYGELTLDGNVAWTDVGDANDPTARGYMDVGVSQLDTLYPSGTAPAPAGTALLLVENGASLTDPNSASIAADPNTAGSVTIQTGGIWNIGTGGLGIGYAGSGTLDVLNSGTVEIGTGGFSTGHSLGADGTLLVSGPHALVTVTGGVSDGKGGQGFIQVLNGGTLVESGTSGFTVGESLGSKGLLIVGDTISAQSAFLNIGTTARGISVGDLGAGTLEVLSDGTINMDGTTGLGIGTAVAGGLVLVSGSGALLNLGSLGSGIGIGQGTGASGTLDIQNGGSVVFNAKSVGIGIGNVVGSTGTLIVGNAASGATALLTQSAASTGISVGNAGAGTLEVLSAGTLDLNGTGGLAIGVSAAASGLVLVSGAGALLDNGNANGIGVGLAGHGVLDIQDGGTATIAGNGIGVGLDAGASGTIVIDNGLLLSRNTASEVVLGAAGSGILNIGSAGTFVADGGLFIATGTGTGTASINGGTLIASNDIEVGGTGLATLTVGSGGTVNTDNLSLGGPVFGPSGSHQDMALITNGGRIQDTGTLAVWQGSTLSLDGSAGIDVGTSGSYDTGAINLESGHILIGNGMIAAPVLNNGLIEASSANALGVGTTGTLEIEDNITGTGTIDINSFAIMRLDDAVSSGQTVDFAAAGSSRLILNAPASDFGNAFSGFTVGDTITLDSSILTSVTYTPTGANVGTLDLMNGSIRIGGLRLDGNYYGAQFAVSTANGASSIVETSGATGLPPRTLIWTGASDTNFANANNWDDTTLNLNPASAPPDATDSTEFDSNGGVITGTGTASALSFDDGGAWHLASGGDLTATNGVVVGTNQDATLLINDGASIVTTGTAAAVIAASAGASGSSVTVTGPGSTFQITGSLQVGAAGAGALSLTNGATVTATTLDAGVAAGSSGIVTVTDAALTTTDSLSIGDGGTGELSILNGANVTIGGDFDIGLGAGGSGNVDIEDTTGTVYVGGNLNIGQNGGPAVLTVGPGSTLEVDNGFINGGPGGVLNLYTSIDPLVVKNLTINVAASDTTPENVTAYTQNDTFNLAEGADYILNTPSLVGTNSFTLGTVSDTDDTTLILNADTVSATTAIAFTNALGTLVIGTDQLATINSPTSGKSETNPNDGDAVIGGFHGVIRNFTAGDAIMVNTAGPATFTQSGSVISVIENGITVGVLAFDTATSAQAAFTAPDALVDNALCFLAGTLIGTPEGQIEVERLAAGDRVLTASGAVRPVVWVGHGRVLATRGRRGPATPVIVRKGALAPNVPHQDLRVTKGHAFWFDGVLIPVEFLVNHRSILWDDRAQEVSVYHVELDAHDVLLANGAAAESYRDDGNRWLFQNANAGWDLPAQGPCAAVLTGGPVVDEVWRRLLEACGPRPSMPLTQEADLHLLVDGVRVDGVRTGEIHVFAVNASDRVRLGSRSAVPQELGLARDPRSLGVAVRRMSIRQGTRFRTIRGDDARLADGFHPFEPGTALRWTDGDAILPAALFEGFSSPCELVIHLGGTASYIDDGDTMAVA